MCAGCYLLYHCINTVVAVQKLMVEIHVAMLDLDLSQTPEQETIQHVIWRSPTSWVGCRGTLTPASSGPPPACPSCSPGHSLQAVGCTVILQWHHIHVHYMVFQWMGGLNTPLTFSSAFLHAELLLLASIPRKGVVWGGGWHAWATVQCTLHMYCMWLVYIYIYGTYLYLVQLVQNITDRYMYLHIDSWHTLYIPVHSVIKTKQGKAATPILYTYMYHVQLYIQCMVIHIHVHAISGSKQNIPSCDKYTCNCTCTCTCM